MRCHKDSDEYKNGVKDFISYLRIKYGREGDLWCPCKNCNVRKSIDTPLLPPICCLMGLMLPTTLGYSTERSQHLFLLSVQEADLGVMML